MIKTLSTEDCMARLECCDASFSRVGARAVIKWYEELERDMAEPIEFDPVAIRCEWCEYKSAKEAAEDLGWDPDPMDDEDPYEDVIEEAAQEWLEARTDVLNPSDDVVVVRSF